MRTVLMAQVEYDAASSALTAQVRPAILLSWISALEGCDGLWLPHREGWPCICGLKSADGLHIYLTGGVSRWVTRCAAGCSRE